MAWTLIKRDESQKILLLTGQDYVFGRKEVDVILSNDMSISRMHSIIRVEYSPATLALPERIPIVTIKDTSKYGTTVNGKKLESGGASSFVNNDDVILFGIFENIWRISYTPFVCATSGLSKTDKMSTTQNIVRIGGHVVSEWSEACTHLIMSKIFMSMKVINALVSGAPILMPKYFEDVVSEKSWPANLKKYESPAVKSSFYSEEANFQPDARRNNIFKDKHFFLFSSKQEIKFRFSITKTGGKLSMILPSNVTEDLIRQDSSCFLEPSKDSIGNSSFIKLINLLRRNGRRFISEAEIGLSILLCSTEKYCNPKAQGDRLLLGSVPETQVSTESSPFALNETQASDILDAAEDSSMDFEDTTTVIKPSKMENEIKEREMLTKVQVPTKAPIKMQKETDTFKAPNELPKNSKAQKEEQSGLQKEAIIFKANKMQKETSSRMQNEEDTFKVSKNSKTLKEAAIIMQNEIPPKRVKLEPDLEIKMEHNVIVPEVSENIENLQMEVDEHTVQPKSHSSAFEKKVPTLCKTFSGKFISARNREKRIKSEESNLALVRIKIQPMTRANPPNGSKTLSEVIKKSGNKWQKTFKKVPPKTCYSRVSFEINRSKRS